MNITVSGGKSKNTVDRTSTVINKPLTPNGNSNINFVERGPQGVPGPQGPQGPIGGNFNHTQTLASNTWTINHNLGFKPTIELLTVGGVVFEGEIVHTSENQAIVYLTQSIAGTAACS